MGINTYYTLPYGKFDVDNIAVCVKGKRAGLVLYL
jgi:hypothetical protein